MQQNVADFCTMELLIKDSSMDEEVSDRLLEQRLRNRMIETIEVLAKGDQGLIEVNFTEFFEGLFDHSRDGHSVYKPNSAVAEEKEQVIDPLGRMLEKVSHETLHFRTEAEYIHSGCAEWIKPVAQKALKVLLAQGRFREDREEESSTADNCQA